MVKVHLPPMWQKHTDTTEIKLEATTIAEIINILAERFPSLQKWIFNERGEPAEWMNIMVNGQDIRLLQGVDTSVSPEEEVWIILAIAGG